ncbi:hypothetical protein [Amazonocrinis nigriterrae]|uniref:hypothetical protein n=1 Tax=Amazonocrinis nigriterrae TaxID=2840443 RepID=UPI001CED6DC6|nr:hypothetical protein [Amazonocrinis nigriterrae]
MGKTLKIKKRNGRVVASGWNDHHFVVTRNESKEVGTRVLLPYQSPDHENLSIP